MNSRISSSYDSPCEELDAGDQQPCLGAFDGFLKDLGEAQVVSEPYHHFPWSILFAVKRVMIFRLNAISALGARGGHHGEDRPRLRNRISLGVVNPGLTKYG